MLLDSHINVGTLKIILSGLSPRFYMLKNNLKKRLLIAFVLTYIQI